MQKTRVNAASDPYQNQGPRVNLTNILPAAFTRADPKSEK